MSAERDLARRLTFDAGEILLGYFGTNIAVDMKAWADPVTMADRESEAFIRSEIKLVFPEDGIIGEEEDDLIGSSGRNWLVDPLDGTVNFAGGMPVWAVCIALIDASGQPLLNVTHDPIRGETFEAERGKGAFLNGSRLQVSAIDDLSRGLIQTQIPSISRFREPSLALFSRLTEVAPHVRNIGSSALAQAYVASGRMHAHVRMRVAAYDIVGGNLMIEEAGGLATDLAGRPYGDGNRGLLAATPAFHSQILALDLQKHFPSD